MLRRACAARPRRQALGERQSAAGRARVSAGCDVRKDGRARAAIPPSGHVLASCRGILKTARAQIAALLDLFAQHGACQSIEFLALLELRQNRVQQLFEDRNRAVAGQDLRIGNDRLDELADEPMQDCLADLVFALAVALRCSDELREFRSIDDLLSDEGSRRASGNALRTRFRPIERLYATVVHPSRSVLSARTLLTNDQRQGLAVLGKQDTAVSNILDRPAIVEEGTLVVAVALGRNDIGALAEPHRLHINHRHWFFGFS